MNEHQAEILLTRLDALTTSSARIAVAVEALAREAAHKIPGDLGKRREKEERSIAQAAADSMQRHREAAAEIATKEYREQQREDAKTEAQLSLDDLSARLTEISRALPGGMFRDFMRDSVLPKYATTKGGGLSTVNPENYEDVLAECEEFFESRRTGS